MTGVQTCALPIWDEANHGVAGVSARVDGINGSTSDANGSFEFIVPARSKLRTYTLIVDGQGIEAAKVALDGPAPLPVTVTVRRVQPPAARIDLPPDIYVSHYVGLAHVQLALLVQNPTKDVVALSGVRLSLKSPSGDSYELTPEFFSLGEGTAWMPPPVTWHAPSSGPPFLVIMYFTIRSGDFEPLVNSVNKEFAARHLEGKLPTLGVSLLPPYLTQSLQTFMDSHFVWREGSWRATLRSFLDGKPVEVLADFTLDSSDIMAMRRIRQHYSTGIGVFWNVRFGVSPDTRSDRHVVLVVKK